MSGAFEAHSTSAYLTPKERVLQKVTDVKNKKKVKGKHAAFEAGVNKTLGKVHILNDDEYNIMKGARY